MNSLSSIRGMINTRAADWGVRARQSARGWKEPPTVIKSYPSVFEWMKAYVKAKNAGHEIRSCDWPSMRRVGWLDKETQKHHQVSFALLKEVRRK